ncbi:MAG: PEP-CTERM sorting domain-containing protein [Phycisphaeraceae bacterium]
MKMKTIFAGAVLAATMMFAGAANAGLIITGVVDGPRTGGLPKAIELYATSDIADLSVYNLETPNNGGSATGSEFALSGSVSAGNYIWVASESPGFTAYFGFAPTLVNSVANINGDDNVILYLNSVTVDQFGVNGQDGTGQAWDHEDGYAYRVDDTGPDATFAISNWTFSGTNFLDSQGTSGVNGGGGKTVPFGTFSAAIPEPASLALLALGGLTMLRRRRA